MNIKEPEKKEAADTKKTKTSKPLSWLQILWISLGLIAFFVALLFAMPSLIWAYLNRKAKREGAPKEKAYDVHRATMFYLNQLGYPRNNKGPFDHAKNIDAQFGTRLIAFTNVYQKTKYSTQPLTDYEESVVNTFYQPFISSVKKQVPHKRRQSKFLNIYNTIHFFTQPKTDQ